MKKSIIAGTLFLAFFSTIGANAQEFSKHEINVSYSDGIPTTLTDSFSNSLGDVFSSLLGEKTSTKTKSFGTIGIGYRYNITERIKVGGDIAFQQVQTEITNEKTKVTAKRKNHYFIVLPTIAFSYIKTDWIDFYGSAAAGVLLDRYNNTQPANSSSLDKSTNVDFAFQVNPAGIRFGKKIGAFAELGFGHRGIVTAGINYKF